MDCSALFKISSIEFWRYHGPHQFRPSSQILGVEVDCSLLNDQVQPFKHSAPEVYCLAFKQLMASETVLLRMQKVVVMFCFISSKSHCTIMFHDWPINLIDAVCSSSFLRKFHLHLPNQDVKILTAMIHWALAPIFSSFMFILEELI